MSKRSSIVIAQQVLKSGIKPSKPIPIRIDWLGIYRQLDLMDRRIGLTLKRLGR